MTVRFNKGWPTFDGWKVRVRTGAADGRLEDAMRRLGRRFRQRIVDAIDKQDLDWTPLASATIQRKGHDKVYFETGQYQKSIRSFPRRTKTGYSLTVRPTGTHEKAGLPMSELARYLEFGTSRIPARPLWRPIMQEIRVSKEFLEVADLRKAYGF